VVSTAASGLSNSVPVGVKGVKADNNWLDDDFDS
jgi:hypothetical protein